MIWSRSRITYRFDEDLGNQGEVYFVTCEYCGYETVDMGTNLSCDKCGEGPMPSMETDDRFKYDEDTDTYFIMED